MITSFIGGYALSYGPYKGASASTTIVPTAADYHYNNQTTPVDGYTPTSFAAELWLLTDETQLIWTQVSTAYGQGDYCWLAVQDGATYIQGPTATKTTAEQVTVPLAGTGERQVKIIIGQQELRDGQRAGTWLKDVTARAGYKLKVVAVVKTDTVLVTDTNSIGVGVGTASPQRDGWLVRYRKMAGYDVISEGVGSKSWANSHSKIDDINSFLNRLDYAWANALTKLLLITLMVNDFRNGSDPASAPSTITSNNLPILLDKIYVAHPTAKVFLQTALPLSDESPVTGSTYTLGDYRRAFSTFVTSYNANYPSRALVLLLGPSILSYAEGGGELHPGTSANGLMAVHYYDQITGINYDALPDGDTAAVPTPLNGSSQVIQVAGGSVDASGGYVVFMQFKVLQTIVNGYPHVVSAGDYNGPHPFHSFLAGNNMLAVEFTDVNGANTNLTIGPIPTGDTSYISICIWAGPSGIGVRTSYGDEKTAPGHVPSNFSGGFTIGGLRQGSSYGYFSQITPSNFAGFLGEMSAAGREDILSRNCLLTKAEYDSPGWLDFGSLKRLSAGDTTMLNLAEPANTITLQ